MNFNFQKIKPKTKIKFPAGTIRSVIEPPAAPPANVSACKKMSNKTFIVFPILILTLID